MRFPFLRKRKPIGWSDAKHSKLVDVCKLLGWRGSPDVLETMASQHLAWLTNQNIGCHWFGVMLSNGAGYLKPDLDGPFRCNHPDRYVDVTMSPAAAGLCVTFTLLGRLQDTELISIAYPQLYRKLHSFLDLHPEYDAIGRVLD
jgi:Antirestriction protein